MGGKGSTAGAGMGNGGNGLLVGFADLLRAGGGGDVEDFVCAAGQILVRYRT